MKKLVAFDLDGTLAESKSQADDRMTELLVELLGKLQVCVISGGKFEQFEKQILGNLKASPELLQRLHIMPTCGTRYYTYDVADKSWRQVYAENFTEDEKTKIIDALNKGFDNLGYREEKVYGECIEDRGSQITFSVLGQDIVDELGKEGLRLKHEWDPDNKKKLELRDYIAPLIPEFEVRVGGVTSIDVTKLGIDKAYGMKKLTEILKISKEDILFIGDRLQEGGNDYPVKAMGVDSIEISHWKETAVAVEAIVHVV
ncbi:MAG TPA: HAD-IIB family hydrolase [Candidatus Saccharimonadales bacterium]|nr:HAD-IIB family hydrolase [Candidatus Saccharimonadales bacterium]